MATNSRPALSGAWKLRFGGKAAVQPPCDKQRLTDNVEMGQASSMKSLH